LTTFIVGVCILRAKKQVKREVNVSIKFICANGKE